MVNCSQCGKPAIVSVGGSPLCVDCNLKLQQATDMQIVREIQHVNFSIAEMEILLGFPSGTLPRYEVHKPIVYQRPFTFNNIKVDKSVVGVINTGNIKAIDNTMSNIKLAGDEELAKAVGDFTEAILKETKISNELKNQLVEQLSFIASQYSLPKENRKTSIIKAVLSSVKEGVSTVASLLALFDKLRPLLEKIFF